MLNNRSSQLLCLAGSLCLAAGLVLLTDQVAEYGWAAFALLAGAQMVAPYVKQVINHDMQEGGAQ